MFVHIAGTGSYLPKRIVTNDEIAQSLDTSDEWIFSHTGIHARHIASDDEQTSTMAYEAAVKALERASVKPEELGAIIVASSTGDYYGYPSVACLLQGRLGCKRVGAFDVQAACSGFLYSLRIAYGLMQTDPRPVLVVGAETMTRTLDWKDRNVCILFGDGAGAAVLKADDQPGGILEMIIGADGTANPPVLQHTGGTLIVPGDPPEGKLRMNGRAVFNFAVKVFDEMIGEMLSRSGKTYDDLKLVVSHQANARIIEAVARRVGQPMGKFFLNIENVGNTSAASVPIALDEAVQRGAIQKGDLIASVAFGAGLAYAGALIRW
ncbi:MAG: ketoacyl-ACP synthase III [Kiritimatiellae bacterium]|nr:ketoacyl-ACP synthase III [Kiritimatiellia bacterium]